MLNGKSNFSSIRLLILAFFVFFLFAALSVPFYKLQIIQGSKWHKLADLQHFHTIKEPARRGVFYFSGSIREDHPSKPAPIVIDVPKFHLFIDPIAIPTRYHNEVVTNLKQLLANEKIRVSLEKEIARKSRSRRVALFLDQRTKEEIEQWFFSFAKKNKIARNAVYFVKHYKRSYPYKNMLGSLLHTIRDDPDATTNQSIPTGGLEHVFQNILEGVPGKKRLIRSPKYPFEPHQNLKEPVNGSDVYLTINQYVQAISEEEIERGVKKAYAKSGWAIVMDPHSGEILALAQYPCLDPSKYKKYYNDPDLLEHTKLKAITDAYEMGSTMKPITVAIALLANDKLAALGKAPLFDPDEFIDCSDGHFPGRTRPIRDISYNKKINLNMAIQKSSNIYMATLTKRIVDAFGADWYREKLHEVFGFGKKTGINFPSESSGFLPTPGKRYKSGRLQWSTPTTYSLAMGYNILVNSMQVITAHAILANGGYQIKPHFIQKVIKSDGSILETEIIKNKVLDERHCKRIRDAMKFVTKSRFSKADIYGFTEGGKSSSSEKIVDGKYSHRNHISSYVGFVPAGKPKYICLAVIDEPKYGYIPGVGKAHLGGNCAGPVFRKIMTRTLQFLGEKPDDPHGYPIGDPRFNPEKADYYFETKKLEELFRYWNQ